jgi:hypothetical protein
MSLQIYVDAFSGYNANERPIRFHLDDETYGIASIEDRWQEPNAEYFKVRTADGKRYLLRYDEHLDEWTLQSGFDADELMARPGIELITVEPRAIEKRKRESPAVNAAEPMKLSFLSIGLLPPFSTNVDLTNLQIADVAYCRNCLAVITEKMLVQPDGGIEIEVTPGQ